MKYLTYLFLLIAVGCASLGVPTPKSFNERAAAAQTTATAIIDGANVLLKARKITPDDAINVVKQTDTAMEAISVARTLIKSDPAAANSKLTATLVTLQALQAYLATKEGS